MIIEISDSMCDSAVAECIDADETRRADELQHKDPPQTNNHSDVADGNANYINSYMYTYVHLTCNC